MAKSCTTHRDVSDKLLKSAVKLSFAFKIEDKVCIAKEFLGTDFHIHRSEINDGRILDRIEKPTVDDFSEIIRDLLRETEEFTQALEQCTGVMKGFVKKEIEAGR